VKTIQGDGVFKIAISEGAQRGTLFAPIHWSDQTASSARICELVAPHVDPYSGQPEAKGTPASVAPVDNAFRGFALARHAISFPSGTWWARTAVDGGHGYLIALVEGPKLWREHLRTLIDDAEFTEFIDIARGVYRAAAFRDGRLELALFIGPAETTPCWDAIKILFEAGALIETQRRTVLSGRSTGGLREVGPIVCACFGVGLNVIHDAIASKRAADVEGIGKALRAGTNCGSCLPELKRIIHDHAHAN
jgi:assimilatory nitrate reductase catalytic subunit